MNSTRKPRGGVKAWHHQLTPAQRETLVQWLTGEVIAYKTVRERIKAQWGMEVSIHRLTDFWAMYCAPRVAAKDPAKVTVAIITEHPELLQITVNGQGVKLP